MNTKAVDQKAVRKKYSPQFKDPTLGKIWNEKMPQDFGLAISLLYSRKAQRKKVTMRWKN